MIRTILAVTGVTLILAGTAAAADGPTLLRSISTKGERGVAVRDDGTALTVSKNGVTRRNPAGGTQFVARLRGNQRATLGPEARAFGVVTYADNAPSTLHAARFDLFDERGERQWRLSKPHAAEFKVGRAGQWTVGIAGADGMHESELYLYDADGSEVGNWSVDYLSDLTLPKQGDRFFAATRRVLMAYPYDGGSPYSFGRFERFAYSPDGRWVVLFGAGSFSVFDGTALAWTGKSQLTEIRALAISPDGRYVAIGKADQLEVYDREQSGRLWTVASGDDHLRFISIAMAGDPLKIVCGLDEDKGPEAPSGQRHTSGAIFMFDSAGRLQWRDDLTYSDWNFQVPGVELSGKGDQLEVVLANERRHYHLP